MPVLCRICLGKGGRLPLLRAIPGWRFCRRAANSKTPSALPVLPGIRVADQVSALRTELASLGIGRRKCGEGSCSLSCWCSQLWLGSRSTLSTRRAASSSTCPRVKARSAVRVSNWLSGLWCPCGFFFSGVGSSSFCVSRSELHVAGQEYGKQGQNGERGQREES